MRAFFTWLRRGSKRQRLIEAKLRAEIRQLDLENARLARQLLSTRGLESR